MPVTESERFALHEQLADKIGPAPAGTLMNQLPRVDSDELATKTDLRQLGDQLRTEMSGLKSELRGEMRALQGEMKELRAEMLSELTGVQGKLTDLRSELTDKMAGHTRTTILAMLAMTVPIWVSMLVTVLVSSTA